MFYIEEPEYGWHPTQFLQGDTAVVQLFPTGCGLFSVSAQKQLGEHGSRLLVFIEQGEGIAQQGIDRQEYGAGSVVVCADEPATVLAPQSQTKYICIALSGADAFLERLRGAGLVHMPPLSSDVENTFTRICTRVATDARQDIFHASAEIYGLLMELCALCSSGRAQYSALVRQAVTIIREEYAFLEGVEGLADTLGVSKSHLIRQFKEQTGISPGKYLELVRMESARQLLQNQEYSIELVANMTGYACANYFCKVFRRVQGESPGSWRARHPAPVGKRLAGGEQNRMHL